MASQRLVPCPWCGRRVSVRGLDRHRLRYHAGDGGVHPADGSGPRRLLGLDEFGISLSMPVECWDELARWWAPSEPFDIANIVPTTVRWALEDLEILEEDARDGGWLRAREVFVEARRAAQTIQSAEREVFTRAPGRARRIEGRVAGAWFAAMGSLRDLEQTPPHYLEILMSELVDELDSYEETLRRLAGDPRLSEALRSVASAQLDLHRAAKRCARRGVDAVREVVRRVAETAGRPAAVAELEDLVLHSPRDPAGLVALAGQKAGAGDVEGARALLRAARADGFLASYFALEEVSMLERAALDRDAADAATHAAREASSRESYWVRDVERRLELRLAAARLTGAGERREIAEAARLAGKLLEMEDYGRFPDYQEGGQAIRDAHFGGLLAQLEAVGAPAVPVVVDLCLFEGSWCQIYAAGLMARSGDGRAPTVLARMCRSEHELAAEAAARSFSVLGEGALPTVLEALGNAEEHHGEEGTLHMALEAIGTPAAEAAFLEVLRRGIRAGDYDEVELASLHLVGFPDAKLLPQLRRAREAFADVPELDETIRRLETMEPRWPVDGVCQVCGGSEGVAALRTGDFICKRCWARSVKRFMDE